MAETVTMPKLGFDMAEGTLVRWVKAEGEAVQKGEVLAEIETDKATVEVESAFGGLVYRHLVRQGEVVPVGTPIAVIAAPGEEVKDVPEAAAPVKDTPAPQGAAEAPAPAAAETPASTEVEKGEEEDILRASPLAKRMASEHGLNLAKIQGSGPGGRIVRRDVEKAIGMAQAAPAPARPAAPAAEPVAEKAKAVVLPLPGWSSEEVPQDEVVAIDRLRAAIGKRMVESRQQIPHFYVTHEYDFLPLKQLRQQVNALLPEDQKISVNDFIVKAVALALRRYPNLNASLADGKIVRHGSINIGVAVAVKGGLLTVVCRDADRKPLRLISNEVRQMVERARQGKVRPEDIEGSTFSISNLGMYNVEEFVAIINPPEAAILAVGSAKEVPVVVNGEVKVGMRLKATISADHRLSDGAEAAEFMLALEDYLQKPMALLV